MKHEALPEERRRAVLLEILPWLRGQVSQKSRFIGTVQDDERQVAVRFAIAVTHSGPFAGVQPTQRPLHSFRARRTL